MIQILYLDATAFLYPILYADAKAARAADILRGVSSGEDLAVTSTLTFDEVVYKVGKELGRDAALAAADAFITFPNLQIAPVAVEHLRRANALLHAKPRLAPRDAIHAAVALASGADRIASDDQDFDHVEGLSRITFRAPTR